MFYGFSFFQVTLVGKDSYNDTFAMTRKDEELLVGAILQKIVVPNPAITHLEAIEVSVVHNNICILRIKF